MASTLPVRTHRHTGTPWRRCPRRPRRSTRRRGRSTTEAGLWRHAQSDDVLGPVVRQQGSTYADDEDSAGAASPAVASSSTDARAAAAACLSCVCRVTAAACSDSALAYHAVASPWRRESRSSSSAQRRASRSASAAFSRSLVRLHQNRLVVAPQPIDHR
ncbi:LOW QUALITY PROTEIN: hypothetical protein BDA96_06G103800 [Sorghum bicolor]|uniref:Uncharacterized protein n=1 Tax=Sorghum bicolor TaxID=4558 RepID=A0A921QSS5_SORBI|nr:LOW QUALITY PROTEIN: hypothetical protein BDA96_06G103800 [Sorghum bicolor]